VVVVVVVVVIVVVVVVVVVVVSVLEWSIFSLEYKQISKKNCF